MKDLEDQKEESAAADPPEEKRDSTRKESYCWTDEHETELTPLRVEG